MRTKRKRWPVFGSIALAGAIAAALTSCTTTIIPPPSPQDPVAIYLFDHGRTPSLVLPGADGAMVRYVYGDWDYYALRRNDLGHGIAALFWPTQGALGRKQIDSADNVNSMLRRFNTGVEQVHILEVERAAAARLQQRLDDLFHANRSTLEINEPYSLEFVHHPRRYTCFYNSNHAVAGWLQEVGCEIRGLAMFSEWKVTQGN